MMETSSRDLGLTFTREENTSFIKTQIQSTAQSGHSETTDCRRSSDSSGKYETVTVIRTELGNSADK